MKDLVYEEESYKIIGACMNVHSELGSGFLEAVYQEALALEFKNLNIPFQKEQMIEIYYRGQLLDKKYFADFVCFDKIIIELKALDSLNSKHESQVLNYLKASNYKLGILVNFGSKSLEYKRIVL